MVRFGVYLDSSIPVGMDRNRAEVISETLDLVEYAEELGFDAVFFPEHHFTPEGYDPTPMIMSALAASRTSRIDVGTGLLLLPLHHPLHVVQQAAVIDMASRGRFQLGVGLGYRMGEYEAFGYNRRTRGAVMDESLAVITQYLRGEPFSFEGRHSPLAGVNPVLQPFQGREMPLWVGARGVKAAERAGRYGCSLLAGGAQIAYDDYVNALVKAGHDPATKAMAINRTMYVGDTDDSAWDECGAAILYESRVGREWYSGAADLAADNLPQYETIEQRRKTARFIGSAETVRRDLANVKKRHVGPVPLGWVFVNPRPACLDLELTKRSMERFAVGIIADERSSVGAPAGS